MAMLDLGDDFRSRANECLSPERIAQNIEAILKALDHLRKAALK